MIKIDLKFQDWLPFFNDGQNLIYIFLGTYPTYPHRPGNPSATPKRRKNSGLRVGEETGRSTGNYYSNACAHSTGQTGSVLYPIQNRKYFIFGLYEAWKEVKKAEKIRYFFFLIEKRGRWWWTIPWQWPTCRTIRPTQWRR